MYTLSDLKSEMRWLAESLALMERDQKKLRKDLAKPPLKKSIKQQPIKVPGRLFLRSSE